MYGIPKGVTLSVVCSLWLQASPIELGVIEVETQVESEVIHDVHGEDIKSADLAEALFKQSPSVAMVRRSGVANDVIVRGQKKDNINVTIDGAKVCGACPNRMDPPVSHVLTNTIESIEINEGPYSVEDFGVLSADVKVHTRKPSKEWHGDVTLGYGSWNYQKGAVTLSGGSERVRLLFSASTEKSEQYEDGNGDDFVGQIQREIDAGRVSTTKNPQYQAKYQGLDAYKKQTMMFKLFWDITDTQELKLSYTANRSDDVLYPSSKMDALYDDSDIYNLTYTIKSLGAYSQKLSLQLYQSEVDHPMSTQYREMGKPTRMTHALTTKMQGAKLTNLMGYKTHRITVGVDYSLRNWDGVYLKNDLPLAENFLHSIYDVDTQNVALFLKDEIKQGDLTLDFGLRYDATQITTQNASQQDNDYTQLNGYLFATYDRGDYHYFGGVGKSSRVPDGKELYWVGSPMKQADRTMKAPVIGTPTLNETLNYEVDMGVEMEFDDLSLKFKGFYSYLEDFIAYNASKANNRYESVDATLYGVTMSGSYIATESLYVDYGLSYQKGEKERPLEGQSGTNMPEIPPVKYNLALTYGYDESFDLKAEMVGAGSWSDYDEENGEQAMESYQVFNLKTTKRFESGIELTLGVDNLFDTTYAVSNTYKDLILLPTVTRSEVMLMNEPGRYFYTHLKYTF